MQTFRAWIWVAIFFSLGVSDNWSAEPEVRFNLLTLPSARQAELRLALPANMNYEHAPLRACMQQLAERFQVSYWIDRRVDADKPISVKVPSGTVRDCLIELAHACDAEVGLIENVVTIAKPEHLAAMQYAAVRLHNQMSAAASSAEANGTKSSTKSDAQMRALDWPLLTTPSELLTTMNSSWQVNLAVNLPHDLMNAGRLQPCTLSTQLTLLLGGFDRCAAGKRAEELRFIAMPPAGNWMAEYSAGQITNAHAQSLAEKFPNASAEKKGNFWKIVGPTAAHLYVLQPAGSPPATERTNRPPRTSPGSDPLAKQRVDISKQVDKPIGAILKNLGDQLGLTVQWDESLPPAAPHTLVTIEANKSRLDEILDNLAHQAQLKISRQGTQVSVSAK